MDKNPIQNNGSKILISGLAIILVFGAVVAYSVNSENTRAAETKKNNETAAMSKSKEDEKMMMKKEEEAKMNKDAEAMKKDGDVMKKEEGSSSDVMKKDTTVTKAGSYSDYSEDKLALANTGKVVLFFNASWCPTCQATVKDINSNLDKIDSGVNILGLDYDKETALKKKYGVTSQHTFVQVDASGNQIKKQTGLNTVENINNFLK